MTDIIEYCKNYPSNCLGGSQTFTCKKIFFNYNFINLLILFLLNNFITKKNIKKGAMGHIGALCEACDLLAIQWNESYSNSGF